MHFNAVKITVPAVSSVRLYSFFLLQTHSTFVILEYVLYYYNFIKEKKKIKYCHILHHEWTGPKTSFWKSPTGIQEMKVLFQKALSYFDSSASPQNKEGKPSVTEFQIKMTSKAILEVSVGFGWEKWDESVWGQCPWGKPVYMWGSLLPVFLLHTGNAWPVQQL